MNDMMIIIIDIHEISQIFAIDDLQFILDNDSILAELLSPE